MRGMALAVTLLLAGAAAQAQTPNPGNARRVVLAGAGSGATVRDNLTHIKLPPGFRIEPYAMVPDARHLAVAPNTITLE
jgi:hypothetical protein